jgi:hypothetical protein
MKMTRYAPEVKTIEQRLQELKDQFAEVQRFKGIPGPRGPAGNIDAAVANATNAANQIVADVEGRIRESIAVYISKGPQTKLPSYKRHSIA